MAQGKHGEMAGGGGKGGWGGYVARAFQFTRNWNAAFETISFFLVATIAK